MSDEEARDVDFSAGLVPRPEAPAVPEAGLDLVNGLLPPGAAPFASLDELRTALADIASALAAGVRYSLLMMGHPDESAAREKIALEVANSLLPAGAPPIATVEALRGTLADAHVLYSVQDGLMPFCRFLDGFLRVSPERLEATTSGLKVWLARNLKPSGTVPS